MINLPLSDPDSLEANARNENYNFHFDLDSTTDKTFTQPQNQSFGSIPKNASKSSKLMRSASTICG